MGVYSSESKRYVNWGATGSARPARALARSPDRGTKYVYNYPEKLLSNYYLNVLFF